MAYSYANDSSPGIGNHIGLIDPFMYNDILQNHLTTADYLVVDRDAGPIIKKADLPFVSNNNIWEKIILDDVRRTNAKIKLLSFFIFDWFPRSPGLFHTQQGYDARQYAKDQIESTANNVTVYNPYGKLTMLHGGFGNIRLKPITLENRLYYLLTASDNGICHEGFPLAVPSELYDSIVDELNDRGAVVRDVIGTLRSVPNEIDGVYQGYKGVPKVYLQVEEMKAPSFPKRRSTQEMSVTVATSFISCYEGDTKIYASWVGFDPSHKKELKACVDWMESVYVQSMYKGKVLTDFDQTTNHFDEAPFTLKKVMNLEVTPEDIRSVAETIGVRLEDTISIQNSIRAFIKTEKKLFVPTIFISYNHHDINIAKRVQQLLEQEKFKVIRDEESMESGANIKTFITESIRQSGFTLSIVSTNSLESAWVSIETITSAYGEALLDRKFLPVYIDTNFFDPKFVDDASDRMDTKLEVLRVAMQERNNKDRGIDDLQVEYKRLRDLRHHLPEIIAKLKESRCIDLTEDAFENGIQQIVTSIKRNGEEHQKILVNR